MSSEVSSIIKSKAMPVCGSCGICYNPRDEHACQAVNVALERASSPNSILTEFPTRVAGDGLREHIANDLSYFRYERGFDETDIREVKNCVTEWVDDILATRVAAIQPFLRSDVSKAELWERMQAKPFDGLATAAQEMKHAATNVPILKPRAVQATAKHKVVSFRLAQLFERKLQHDTAYRKFCRAKSNKWKRGEFYRTMPTGTISDMDEAVAMRFHPWLMKPATADEADDFRIGYGLQTDDVEVRIQAPRLCMLCPSSLRVCLRSADGERTGRRTR